MRGDEALQAITYFVDDAILVGMDRVRILHGTGTGILRTLIRQLPVHRTGASVIMQTSMSSSEVPELR